MHRLFTHLLAIGSYSHVRDKSPLYLQEAIEADIALTSLAQSAPDARDLRACTAAHRNSHDE